MWQRGSWELGGGFSPEKHCPCMSENGPEGPWQHVPGWEEGDEGDGERGCPAPEHRLFFPLCLMVLGRAWRGREPWWQLPPKGQGSAGAGLSPGALEEPPAESLPCLKTSAAELASERMSSASAGAVWVGFASLFFGVYCIGSALKVFGGRSPRPASPPHQPGPSRCYKQFRFAPKPSPSVCLR